MKTNQIKPMFRLAFLTMAFGLMNWTMGASAMGNTPDSHQPADSAAFSQFKGKVVDAQTGEPLVFASLSVTASNISTVCNSEGEFVLKVPGNMVNEKVLVSFLGYKSKVLSLVELAGLKKIALEGLTVSLAEINVFPKDPNYLMRAVMGKRVENYSEGANSLTAFYREGIKKGRSYVSLSEAVVEIYKQPYSNLRSDFVKLYKGRKSTDYSKLDTLTFKLMGGPHSTLMMDVAKNPYLVFTDDMFGMYDFSIGSITRINERLVYVIDFKQKAGVDDPLYFGKLYIDSESLAITSAAFGLNVADKAKASEMMIHKKPAGAVVYPTEANYMVNYTEKDGKWYLAYARGQINFKVDWDKRFFNTYYYTTIELAVTDRIKTAETGFSASERLKPNVVMEDAVSGFGDKNFWGQYNVIEPEQSIEAAIKKIQRQLAE